MPRLHLGYVNVAVSDLERSVSFFSETIGLPLKFADKAFGYASFDTTGAGFALPRAARGRKGAALSPLPDPAGRRGCARLPGRTIRWTAPPR